MNEAKEETMGGLAQFLQKMPGGKYLLPVSAMISMLGGSIEESQADAREYLSYKNGVNMMVPVVLASEFNAGVTRKADGSYVVEDKEKMPTGDTLIGDLVYQSGEEVKLPQDPEKFIKDDLSVFKKELGQTCKDKKLVATLGSEMDKFANETFPEGLGKEGFVIVDGKPTKAQWAVFQAVEAEVAEHMAKVREKIYSIKDNSRAKVTDIVLREYCDLVEKAAVINMARDQEK